VGSKVECIFALAVAEKLFEVACKRDKGKPDSKFAVFILLTAGKLGLEDTK
jgi:hypothetical protein